MKAPFKLSSNIAAGFVGKAWSLVINLAFVPLYIDLLGMAAYGLIGFYTSLVVLLSVLDLGLSATLNREMARLSTHTDNSTDIRNTLRTYEIIYWIVGGILGITILLASHWLSQHWLSDGEIPAEIIRQAVILMGFVIALQWPVALYSGALLGQQRQVWLNAVLSIFAAVRAGGAAVLLLFVRQDILVFFRWQAVSAALATLALAYFTWRMLPTSTKSMRPRFRREILAANWRFSAGMLAISVLTTLLTQIDKVILSNRLTLESFGYYSLASSVGIGLIFLVGPIASAIFPRFTQLVSEGRQTELARLYHQISQLVSVIVLPLSITVIFFSSDLLQFWLHDASVVENTHILLSVIAAGTTLNALVTIPLNLQLAHGWTKPTFYINLFSVLAIVPVMITLIDLHGALGAALAWVFVNFCYFAVYVPFMHTRLLKGELRGWYTIDVGVPLVASVLLVAAAKALLTSSRTATSPLAVLAVFALCFSLCVLVSPYVSNWVKQVFA